MSKLSPLGLASQTIAIRPAITARERKTFIRLANEIYADDPNYVAPLEFELSARIDAAKNPTLKNADHRLWIAYRGDIAVGRIAAIINPAHLAIHNDQTGHFGFFEAIDDDQVVSALFGAAEAWIRSKGMARAAGPYNFSVNEECGLLIDGFDTPPYVMMPHGRARYKAQIESLGYQKARDMHALRYIPTREAIPERRRRFVNKILSAPNIDVRTLKPGGLEDDLRIIVDIYNDAWADNWGFIPFAEDHAKHMAAELRPVIKQENIVICSIDNTPMAFGLVLPNINEAVADFGGRLLPFNWAKFLWRLKISGIKSSRMPLMGLRKSIQGKPTGAAFAYKIIDMVNAANIDHGVTHGELSWVLENNKAMLSMLFDIGGEIYKTYRIYEKAL